MKKLLFICNPNAGRGVVKVHYADIMHILCGSDYEVTVYETKAKLDGKRKVIEDGERYDRIVCFGGDGTLSEVTSGAAMLEKKPEIGFIPAGSTNDTAKNFGIPKDVKQAAQIAVSKKTVLTDLGKFNDTNFIYVAAFGDISAVSAFTTQEMKRKLGHAAYVIEGMNIIPKMSYHTLKVEYDDQVIEGDFYLGMITNSYQVGGFTGIMGKSVDLADGLFEAILFGKPSSIFDFAKQIDGALIKKDDNSIVIDKNAGHSGKDHYVLFRFKASKIRITSKDDVQWVVDGEDAGRHKVAEIENLQRYLEFAAAE